MTMKKIIHWFRRDLRLADNSALLAARQQAEQVIPIFCWDNHILSRPDTGAPRVWFLRESLLELAESVRSRGGSLVILQGKPEDEIPRFALECGAEAVFFNRDYEPYSRKRDALVARRLRESGVGCEDFPDLLIREPGDVLTRDGRPFGVFTPFSKAWREIEPRLPSGEIQNFGGPRAQGDGRIPLLHELKFVLPDGFRQGSWVPGESAARTRLEKFAADSVQQYADRRDLPAIEGTSRLSPYLKFGNVSMRQVYDACRESFKFTQELAWREFYFHVLWHWPEVEHTAWMESRRSLPWDDNSSLLDAWKNGQTGYPIVDAGMRELNATGWMHNRVRMIVASFLTKDLHINWQEGERYFMLRLVDGDLAPNSGGWQWAASVGVDPRPLRIFNPWLQSEKFDPEGLYIRRWVPELEGVPTQRIHRPHEMTAGEQLLYGCRIGSDYPPPVVDHAEERRVAMDRYRISSK